MKKKLVLLLAFAMLLYSAGESIYADADEFGWTVFAEDGTAAVRTVNSIRGRATAFNAFGGSDFEMRAAVSQNGAYAMEFSMLMQDFNTLRTISISGIDILSIDKTGEIKADANAIATARINQWYDAEIYVYPANGTYEVKLEGKTIEGTASVSKLESISLRCTETDKKGTITLISDPVISAVRKMPESSAKTEITSFIQTQGGAPDYVRERIEDPTGNNRGTISHLQLNEKKWMEGRQNASFSGLTEVNIDWYFNDFGSEQNSVAARMNSASGPWNEFITFRHSDKKILLGNTSSTDVIGSDYRVGEWYNIKLLFDFENSMYHTYVYNEAMDIIAEGSKAMDSDYTSVEILSLYIGVSSLPNTSRNSSLYVDNYYFRTVGTGAIIETLPFDGKQNVLHNTDILITASNIIDRDTLDTAAVMLNGKSVGHTMILASPERVKITLADAFVENTAYSLEVAGLKDIFGADLPVLLSFKTAQAMPYGNLELNTEDSVSALLPAVDSASARVYAVAYSGDGAMLDYAMTETVDNGRIQASISSAFDNAAAYAWDSSMNIITPAVKTRTDDYGLAEPCDISIVKTDYNNDIITIKGTAEQAAAFILKDKDDNILMIKEVNALANGYFEAQFKIDYYGNADLYINTQNGQGIQEIKDITFYSSGQLTDIIDKFNPNIETGYVPDYNKLIEEYAVLFGFDAQDYTNVSPEDFAALMIKTDGKYEAVSDILNSYNYAVAVGLFNAAVEVQTAEKLIQRYSSDYNFYQTKTYTYYESLNKTVRNKVYENIIKRADYTSMDDIIDEFEAQAVLAAIECATLNSEILPILKENNDYLQIDFAKINLLRDTSAVTSAMRGKIYSTINDMKTEFMRFVDSAIANQKQNGAESSSSGGSSQSFHGVTLSGENVNKPFTSEIIEDVLNNGKAFEDIKTVAWAEECIIYLANKNIISGKSETHFMPLENITRAEFVKIISLAFPAENMDTTPTPFADIDADAWYGDYVADAYNRGLIKGISSNIFGVNDNISRQDIAVILYRIVEKEGLPLDKVKSVLFYDDAEISDYAKTAVMTLAEGGIINGVNDNMFLPKNSATRAEAAKLVYCLLKQTDFV